MMRSRRLFAASSILIVGVIAAAFAGIVLGDGAELIIHIALGTSFLVIALSTFEFKLPKWLSLLASVAIGLLAIVFLLQAAALALHAPWLTHLAFDVLGQRLEKVLGFAFLAWCVCLLVLDCRGWTRGFGAICLAAILCVEIYDVALTLQGSQAPGILKLLYMPLFVWLLLEARKPATQSAQTAH